MLYLRFSNYTQTTTIYTLSLHDALPICLPHGLACAQPLQTPDGRGSGRDLPAGELDETRRRPRRSGRTTAVLGRAGPDRKSTRLNSSHSQISYAVFCLKKKKINT